MNKNVREKVEKNAHLQEQVLLKGVAILAGNLQFAAIIFY